MVGAPAASTPMTWGRVAPGGVARATAALIPDMRPPPPTGTTITSASGASSSSSSPMVPWPAITSGSSNGGTYTAPWSTANCLARAMQSSTTSPSRRTVAP